MRKQRYCLRATPHNSSAAFTGSFAPILQFRKLTIHTVFLRFLNFVLRQNLSVNVLDSLCGIALNRTENRKPDKAYTKVYMLCPVLS